MNCPVCKISLIMSDRNGVEIDYCPSCRGVWLDRGELDKIIERASGHSQQREDHYDVRDHDYNEERNYHNQQNKKHKKENFLGELFDF